MQPSIESVLESIRAQVASCVEVEVFLGMPDDTNPGVYIVPIRYIETTAFRNFPSSRSDERSAPGYEIACMMVACPANDYAAIGSGIKCLQDHPVLETGNETIQFSISALSLEELTQLFVSMGISLRLSAIFDVLANRKK